MGIYKVYLTSTSLMGRIPITHLRHFLQRKLHHFIALPTLHLLRFFSWFHPMDHRVSKSIHLIHTKTPSLVAPIHKNASLP